MPNDRLKSGYLTVYLPPEIYREFTNLAEKRDIKQSHLGRIAIKSYLNRRKKYSNGAQG